MGKVVSKVLSVAAVAVQFIPGIGQLAAAAITIGLSVGSSLLAKKPKAPRNSSGPIDRLRATIDPRVPRASAVGWTALAVDIR